MSSYPDREAQARAEVGHTEVRRATAWALVLVFLMTVAAVPVWDRVITGLSGEGGAPFADFAAALPEVAAAWRDDGPLAAGRALLARMHELETALERGSAMNAALQPWVQAGLSGGLGAGNEEVYPGVEGWLFLRAGVDSLTGPGFLDPRRLERRREGGESWQPPPRPDPRPALFDFYRQLAERGIALLVMPVPTKAAIEPRRLAPRAPAVPPLVNPSWPELLAQLEAAGIGVFDPAPLLAEPAARDGGPVQVYLRGDTHWRPESLERVARALAERVEAMLGPAAPRTLYTRRAVEVRHAGDLAGSLRLPPGVERRLYPEETVVIHQVTGPDGGLFRPDPAAEVLVLGDSFSNVFSLEALGWGRSAGLAEQLAYFLGRPVDRVAVNGGGDTQARRRLAGAVAEDRARGVDRLAPKRLVVYQFAARELAVGSWELVKLSAP